MKKIIILVVLIVLTVSVKAQTLFPTTLTRGNASLSNTLFKDYGGYTATVGIILPVYFDTASASANLYAKWYDGLMMKTVSPNATWWRDLLNKRWVQNTPAAGPGGIIDWTIGGNETWFGSSTGNEALGWVTGINKGINFVTNGITNVSLNSGGLLLKGSVSDTTANKVMTFNPTSKEWGYGYWYGSGGGGGGSSWNLTGNSGTNPASNFIGTTDAQGLMFKVNNTQAGYIGIGVNENTSLGLSALSSLTSGINNSSVGAYSLSGVTTGTDNVAIGHYSGNSTTTGIYNSFLGAHNSEYSNGNYNTGVGNNAGLNDSHATISTGWFNTYIGAYSAQALGTGYSNTFLGAGSGQAVTTGNNNLLLGDSAGQWLTTESDRLVINSKPRATLALDTTASIIYGAQDATAANQRLYLNSRVFAPYLTNNTSQNRVMGYISGTGEQAFLTLGTGVSINSGVLNATGTGILTASNGLTLTGSNVKWGGTLIENTNVDGNALFGLTLDNLTDFTLNDASNNRIVIDGTQSILFSPNNSRYFNLTNSTTGIVGLANLSTQDRLIGQRTSSSEIGYITIGSGLSLTSGNLTATATGTVTGTGTNNTMTKFTGASSIGNSSVTDDGTTLSTTIKFKPATGTTSLSPLQFTNGAPTTSLAAGNLMFNTGLLILDSTASHRDTLATRNYIRNNSSSFALTNGSGTTATGTAVNLGGALTGNTNIDGAGNTFGVSGGGNSKLQLNADGSSLFGDVDGNSAGNTIAVLDGTSKAYYDNIAHDGNFGINTSTPTGALHVVANSTDALVVDNSGNVGVGTSTPGAKLDVNGSLNIGSGYFTVDGPGNVNANANSFYFAHIGFDPFLVADVANPFNIDLGDGAFGGNGTSIKIADNLSKLTYYAANGHTFTGNVSIGAPPDATANLLVNDLAGTGNRIVTASSTGALSATQTAFTSKFGSFSGVGTATTVFTVTFGGTLPNTTYSVNVTPTTALSAALFYVTNKTTTTFDVTYLAGLTGTVTFDWNLTQ